MKTIKNMLFMGTLLVGTCVMLVGCTEEEVAKYNAELEKVDADGEVIVETDETEDVESVSAEGEKPVSDEYYIMLESIITDGIQYSTKLTKHNIDLFADYRIVEAQKEPYNKTLDEFAVYLKGLNESPSNDLEFKLNTLVNELIFHGESRINYTREFLSTEDFMYRDLAKEEYQKWEDSMNGLLNELEASQLFTE